MQDLFFKPQVTFEKVAAETTLPEDPNMWPNEILQELFKQVPYIADFEPHVVMDTVDAERGYALGHVEVTNKTELQHGASDEAMEGAGVQTGRIPIVVKDKKLQPLDLLITKDSKMLPLTEARLRQAIFRPQAFDITARTPGDQSMIGQLYPPYRQNYGFGGGGGGLSMGAGMGKSGSVDKEAVSKELLGRAAHKAGVLAREAGEVWRAAGKMEPVDHAFRENKLKEMSSRLLQKGRFQDALQKKGSALLLSEILPTINEQDYSDFCNKLASDQGLRLAYAANPHTKMPLFVLGQYEEGTMGKLAAGLHAALTPSVVQIYSVSGGGYIVKSASHQMWAPEEEMLDRAQAIRLLDEKIVLAADLEGGATMTTGEGVVESQDPEADRVDLIDQFGVYKVQDEQGRHLIGYVFPNLLDVDGTSLPICLFTNGSQKAVQGEIVGINVGGGASLFEGPPRGQGAFYEVLPNGRAQATVPFTIKATLQGPEAGQEGVTFMTEKFDGSQVQVCIQPNITKIQFVDGVMLVPDSYCWLPLDKAEDVSLASAPEAFQKEARANPFTHVEVRSDGSLFSVEGLPVQKLAEAERRFLSMDDALFLLAGLGCDPDYALRKMGAAAAFHRPESVLVGREITTAKEAMEAAREKAAAKMPPNMRRDLVKEAAVIPDPTAVDTVLSLGFINPENLATFISYLPHLDEAQSKMCELLLAARLGVRELPVPALERAIRTTEEALQGLKVLAFQQN